MIFVWSSEGGPLQYAGLALFALQFLLPQILPGGTTVEIRKGVHAEVPFGLIAYVFVFMIGLLWIAWHCFTSWQTNPIIPPVNSTSENDSAPYAARDGSTNNANNGNNSDVPLPSLWNRAKTFFFSLSPTHLMLASGFVLPLSAAIPFIMAAGESEIFTHIGIFGVMLLAIVAHSCMAYAAYRVLRDLLSGVSPFPGARGEQGGRGRGRKFTMGEISELVRKVPVEEFVSEEDIKTGGCSISRMKRMLKNRGSSEAADRCVERDELVSEISRVRKYNEECAICAEQYEEG